MHFDELLLNIQKPGRYIGSEWNVSRKDSAQADVTFALCFPDLYEVGMSNLGIRILYDVLNRMDGVACERCFCPERDMQERLRTSGQKLFALESRQPLDTFDIVGFSLGYELCYTNVLAMLDLSGIPFAAHKRDNRFPLIIGGGPCVMNPEPVAEFFDLFLFGEGEEAVKEIVETYRAHKKQFKDGSLRKEDLLLQFARIPGVYVPSLYEADYNADGSFAGLCPRNAQAPQRIPKRVVQDFDTAPFPCDWIVPYIQIVHDRITLETMRGCPNRCRFCQARQQYAPFRIRKPETLMKHAQTSLASTGYEEVALAGLSASDYPHLESFVERFTALFKEKAIGISLPSLKPKTILATVSSLIASVRKSGFTFAPEAGSPRLRAVLGKDLDDTDLLDACRSLYKAGYDRVKLYFMIGLPGETADDLNAILTLANTISHLRREVQRGPAEVNVSINALIPKPHTPFQWCPVEPLEAIEEKQKYLRDKNRNKRIKLHFHKREMSFVEAVLSRGDRRLSAVIACAYTKGCYFDAWDNYFAFERWQEAFQECGLNPHQYLHKRDYGVLLPWDILDTGVAKEILLKESKAALSVTGSIE